MAVDKALNQAPLGLDASFSGGVIPGVNMEPDIEIEIEDPESVSIGMDGLEIEIEPGDDDEDSEFDENLADVLDEGQLTDMVGDLIGDYDDDIASRKDWIQTYVDGLELLGMKVEDRTEPWPGACGVYHPLLAESVVKFQAETMMETFPAQGPVRTQIIGKETPQKRDAARRVQDDMNYQLTDVMTEYRPEHERMLWGLGLAGNAFKKVYYDPSLGRQVSMFVTADDVVVPYGASNLETAERVTHVMRKTPNELKKLQRDGFYRDVDLGDPDSTLDEVEKKIAERLGFRATTDDRYKLLEMQVDLIIDDDKFRDDDDEGVALPYIVTLEKGSNEVLAIRRNWQPDDKLKRKRNHFVHYSYVPGFGFYAFGLIHLIGAFAKSGTSLIRQLVDAGTLSNLPGGFKTKGLRVKGDDTPISPAEWRDVDVASGTMRDNIMPLPYKEPSQVLYSLLGTIVEEGRRFAGMADLQVSDMSANAPVGTTLAILERSLKMMSAVQARIHYSMKQEFKLLKYIIADYTPETYSYEPEEGSRKAKKSDYDNVDVLPVSDPNAATMAQKIVQYQAVIQLAQGAPQIYDMPYLHRQMLEVLGIKNASKLVPLKDDDDRKPRDPVSENMDVLNMKPVKAFIYQDHEAHIAVHMAAIQDPKIQQLVGQSPAAQQIMAAMAAHIQEHVAFEYRRQIELQAGVPLPPPDSDMSEEIELQISRLAAAAAGQLLQKNQAEAQQQKNQQMQQDPIVQMQMAELEIKKGELELKKQKMQVDAAEKNDRLELEEKRIAAQKEIAGLQVGAKIATDKANLSAKQQEAGLRIGVEIARETAQTAKNPPEIPVSNAPPKENR
tara:strand:- start:152 stop:2662 length:2511 start_codon:yes stop_codon:yes gene_type:complete